METIIGIQDGQLGTGVDKPCNILCSTNWLGCSFAIHDGKFTAKWNAWLSFPTTIAIVAKASQSGLMISVASCVSQLAWLHFREKPRPVLDFQRFDAATRSPLGVSRLLFTAPTKSAIMIFLIAILGLGFEAALQQCLEIIGPKSIPLLAAMVDLGSAWGFASQNSTATSSLTGTAMQALTTTSQTDYLAAPLSATSPNGLSRTQVVLPRTLDYSCTTPNYVPPPYATLSMCSRCHDISHELVSNSTGYIALFSGGGLDTNKQIFAMTPHRILRDYDESWKGILTLANFSMINYVLVDPSETKLQEGRQRHAAQRCIVNLCTNIYQLDISEGDTGVSGANETLLATGMQAARDDSGNPNPLPRNPLHRGFLECSSP